MQFHTEFDGRIITLFPVKVSTLENGMTLSLSQLSPRAYSSIRVSETCCAATDQSIDLEALRL